MALPTIKHQYVAAATGSSDIEDFMTALQTQMFAAGWSIKYADADAIGGGSSSVPAWDKAYSSNADAGVAVYQMPANGFATQWFVRLRPAWGNSAARVYVAGVTVGTTHDGSGGVTGGPAELTAGGATSNTNASEVAVSASEDGLFLWIGATISSSSVFVERLRASDGTPADDLIVRISASSVAQALVRAGVGLVTDQAPIVLAGLTHNSPTSFGVGASIVNGDGDEIPIVGPFWPGGDPFYGAPRLAFIGPANDYVGLSTYSRVVDGGAKDYLAANQFLTANWGRWMVATE